MVDTSTRTATEVEAIVVITYVITQTMVGITMEAYHNHHKTICSDAHTIRLGEVV